MNESAVKEVNTIWRLNISPFKNSLVVFCPCTQFYSFDYSSYSFWPTYRDGFHAGCSVSGQ